MACPHKTKRRESPWPSRAVLATENLDYGWLPAIPATSDSLGSLASELLLAGASLSGDLPEYFSNTTTCKTGCRSSMGLTSPFCCRDCRYARIHWYCELLSPRRDRSTDTPARC